MGALSPMSASSSLPVALQLAVLALQAVEAQRVAQREQQAVEATGFSTKSSAPRRVALTAVSTVAWPLIRMTGTSGARSRTRARNVEAVHLRHHHVGEDRVHRLLGQALQARARRTTR